MSKMEHLTMHTFADSTSSHNNLLIWSVVSCYVHKLLITLIIVISPEEVGHPHHQSHGNGMCGYNVYSRLLTFNLSLDFSIAMVPVVDLLLCSLASSHTF